MDLSISIVSYNNCGLLKRCVASILKNTKGLKFEIIVIDNASTDGTLEMLSKNFPSVKVIENKKNLFFAEANNQALKLAKGKYFLLLNSDTYFADNSIKTMVNYLIKNKTVGAVEGLEIYENGEILKTGSMQSSALIDFYELSLIGKRLSKREIVDDFRLSNLDRRKEFDVGVGCDAFLMIRKDLMTKIGGYDENFKLFYTENDLCLKIKNAGYKVMHLGSAKVIHRVSASTEKLGWNKNDIYYQDLWRYYRKNGEPLRGTILFLLLKFEEAILKIRN